MRDGLETIVICGREWGPAARQRRRRQDVQKHHHARGQSRSKGGALAARPEGPREGRELDHVLEERPEHRGPGALHVRKVLGEEGVDEPGLRAGADGDGHGPLEHPGAAEVRLVGVDGVERGGVGAAGGEGVLDAVGDTAEVAADGAEAAEGERGLDPRGVADGEDAGPGRAERGGAEGREDAEEDPLEGEGGGGDPLVGGQEVEVGVEHLRE